MRGVFDVYFRRKPYAEIKVQSPKLKAQKSKTIRFKSVSGNRLLAVSVSR
jgi:hypothetical protein